MRHFRDARTARRPRRDSAAPTIASPRANHRSVLSDIGLSLRDSAVDLPGCGGDTRLEAQAPDDLFEGRVIATCGDRLRRDDDLGGIRDVRAIDAAKTESGLGERVQKERAHVRFLCPL